MYYLVKSKENDFSDLKVIKIINCTEEFYDFIDNKQDFKKDRFLKIVSSSMEDYSGVMDLKNNMMLVNISYNSEQDADIRLDGLKHKIRNYSIDSITES